MCGAGITQPIAPRCVWFPLSTQETPVGGRSIVMSEDEARKELEALLADPEQMSDDAKGGISLAIEKAGDE